MAEILEGPVKVIRADELTAETATLQDFSFLIDNKQLPKAKKMASEIVNALLNHNLLSGKQGGTTGEYNHLTDSELASLADIGKGALFKTVGLTGADYTKISTAVAAGDMYLRIINEPASEGADIVASTMLYIIGNDKYNDINIQFQSARFLCNLYARNIRITYVNSVAEPLFYPNSDVRNFKIIHVGVQANTPIFEGIDSSFVNGEVTIPNFDRCGFGQGNLPGVTLQNIKITGGGASCKRVIDSNASENTIINGITLLGTFQTNTETIDAQNIDGVFCDTNCRVFVRKYGNNIRSITGTSLIQLRCAPLSNVHNSEVFNLVDLGATDAKLFGVDFDGAFTNGTTDRVKYTNCIFNEKITDNSTSSQFVNCRFVKGIDIGATAIDIQIVVADIGVAGGATYLINILAGALRTKLGFIVTEVATANAGTGTILDPNETVR